MTAPSTISRGASSLPCNESTERKKLSRLDGHLRAQLYRACEEFGTEAAFARAYDCNEKSVNDAMNGRYPVRGGVLMAVLAHMFGVREPVGASTRYSGRDWHRRKIAGRVKP